MNIKSIIAGILFFALSAAIGSDTIQSDTNHAQVQIAGINYSGSELAAWGCSCSCRGRAFYYGQQGPYHRPVFRPLGYQGLYYYWD